MRTLRPRFKALVAIFDRGNRRGRGESARIRRWHSPKNNADHLRGVAHPLNPIIMIGNAGLTDAVVLETSRALHDHELIKVKVRGAEREDRDAMLAALAQRTVSELVHRIGHVGVLYKAHPKLPRVQVPAAD